MTATENLLREGSYRENLPREGGYNYRENLRKGRYNYQSKPPEGGKV